MQNLGVLIQEFGWAGRGGEQADGYLWYNEYKDNQCLMYWTMGCSSEEVESIKKSYEDSWRWIYGVYYRTCLRETLLQSYKQTNVIFDQTEGEWCSRKEERGFNAKDLANLLLAAIKELEEIFCTSDIVNGHNLVYWLFGAKRTNLRSASFVSLHSPFQIWEEGSLGKHETSKSRGNGSSPPTQCSEGFKFCRELVQDEKGRLRISRLLTILERLCLLQGY